MVTLLENGADANVAASNGMTPLMYAARLVKILLTYSSGQSIKKNELKFYLFTLVCCY